MIFNRKFGLRTIQNVLLNIPRTATESRIWLNLWKLFLIFAAGDFSRVVIALIVRVTCMAAFLLSFYTPIIYGPETTSHLKVLQWENIPLQSYMSNSLLFMFN